MDRRATFAALGFVILFPGMVPAAGRNRIKQLRPNWKGSTGLFNLAGPETLRTGEFSLGLHHSRFHRMRGQVRITQIPLSFTLGLRDSLEIFLSWEARKWLRSRQMEIPAEGRFPGDGSSLPNDLPHPDLPNRAVSGDLWAGLKLSLWSPSRGNAIGFALQPKMRISTSSGFASAFPELDPGGPDLGLDVLISRQITTSMGLTVNGGFLVSGDGMEAVPRHQFDYGLGLDFPLGREATFVAELVGTRFGSPSLGTPLALHLGMTLLSRRWFQLSAGYRLNLSHAGPHQLGAPDAGRHGWTAQFVVQRKINRPPVLRCRPDRQTIKSGESAKIQVYAMDFDDDVLSISWIASGGTVSLQGNTARFDATGLEEGIYTISAELSDSESNSECTVEIRVGRGVGNGK